MRRAEIKRTTNETDIYLELNIDGSGKSDIDTGCGFLDHMLTLFARHGRFDLTVKCKGDTYVDYHHTTEDIAICLGKAFSDALGDKKGVVRYGNIVLPMDESLILSAVGKRRILRRTRHSDPKGGRFRHRALRRVFYRSGKQRRHDPSHKKNYRCEFSPHYRRRLQSVGPSA